MQNTKELFGWGIIALLVLILYLFAKETHKVLSSIVSWPGSFSKDVVSIFGSPKILKTFKNFVCQMHIKNTKNMIFEIFNILTF